jgi:glycosyltransferase involved in cell wall biosynthesis
MRVALLSDQVRSLAFHIDYRGPNRQHGLRARINTVLATLTGAAAGDGSTAALLRELDAALDGADAPQLWLALAILDGRLPQDAAVQRAARSTKLEGPLAALTHVIRSPRLDIRRAALRWPSVEVVTGEVVVDMHHTSQTTFATGIQRVARQSALRWERDYDPVFIGWTADFAALRRLDPSEVENALHGTSHPSEEGHETGVVVPWRSTYVLPELLADPPRAELLRAMVEYSGSTTSVIGFDCVPLTSAETTSYLMSGGFALNLAAVAQMDRVATISEGAAVEYRGWRTMLRGVGLDGPGIVPIPLPIESNQPTEAGMDEARQLLTVASQPMVLVVGSHEPRKNHLAVLHAAELLWREGLQFSLNFVGGNAWNSERFTARLEELRAAGRPVQSVSALSDDLLWAAYRLAHCTLFPSLNEGFGLPVAESLASGTPVITSDFGSMREIAAFGGALLVDPRNDHDIADGLRQLLTQTQLHRDLTEQARRRPLRTWDEYAEETWQYLVHGIEPHLSLAVTSAGV